MTQTVEKIQNYLKNKDGVYLRQLAKELDLSYTTVWFWVKVLKEKNIVNTKKLGNLTIVEWKKKER